MATLPGLVKDPAPPATDTEISPITIPNGTTLITTKQHNLIIDYLSGDNSPDFIPQSAIDSLVSDLAAKEDTANKGAISGYAGLDASQELLLANFPTGTSLQVLRRDVANTALEFATISAGDPQTPWLSDIDADGFDLVGVTDLTLTNDINMSDGGQIIWAGIADRRIFNNTAGMTFEVSLNDSFVWLINSALEMTLSSTGLNMNGGRIEEINFIEFIGAGTEADAGDIRFNVNSDIAWRNNANSANLLLSVNGSDQLVFDGTILGQGAAQTPWTSNIDGAGFNLLLNGGILQFANSTEAISTTGGDMSIDMPTGNTYRLKINAVIEYAFSASTFDVSGNAIDNVLSLTMDGATPGALTMNGADFRITFQSGGSIQIRDNIAAQFQFGSTLANWMDNDLINMGVLSFDDSDTSIQQASADMLYDIATGGMHSLRINNIIEYDFGASIADFNGNDLFLDGGELRFGDANTRIDHVGTTLEFNVDTGDTFDFDITEVTEYSFSATAFNAQGNDILINSVTGFSLSVSDLDTVIATGGAFRVAINSITEYDFDAGQVDFNVNHIMNLGQLEFSNSSNLGSTQAGIWAVSTAMRHNVPAGDSYEFKVALIDQFTISATDVNIGGNTLTSVGNVTMNDTSNIILNATTGTKIGTATTQKLGFWNATPIVQPTHIADPSGGATVDAEARTAINSILAQLASMGLQASV